MPSKSSLEIHLFGQFRIFINGENLQGMFRILKPGGGFQIADTVLTKPVSEKSNSNTRSTR